MKNSQAMKIKALPSREIKSLSPRVVSIAKTVLAERYFQPPVRTQAINTVMKTV